MRRDWGFREVRFSHGFAMVAVATLGVAALLVVAGLAWELSQLSMTVVTQAPPVVAYQMTARPTVAQAAAAQPLDVVDEVGDGDSADPIPAGTSHLAIGPSGAAASRNGKASPRSDAAANDVFGPPEPTADDPGAELPPAPSPEETPAPASSPVPSLVRSRPPPGPRGAPRPSADLPIVMFHHVGPLPPNPDVFRRDLTVSAELFEAELKYLVEQQATTVSPDDLMEHYAGGPELPKRAVILTFDDGYDDAYEHAFRLLQQYGMVGTFYIITDFVGRPGYLTWDQIAEMDAAGMTIGAHSLTHPDFTLIGAAELRRQLTEPRRVLEEHLGHPVVFLAYPSGKYNAATIAASRAAGYVAAVTVVHGLTHPASAPFEMTRVRAHGADTSQGLAARLTPAAWRR